MSRVSGTGSYGYGPPIHNPANDDELNVGARAAMGDPDAQAQLGPEPEQLTAAQIKRAYEMAQAADITRQTRLANSNDFVLMHPEYVDSPSNGQKMNAMLVELFGESEAFLPEQITQAYRALRVTNSLEIDTAEEVKASQAAANAQRKAANKARADKAARVFNPAANYDEMPLEELRKRANEELSGERGTVWGNFERD